MKLLQKLTEVSAVSGSEENLHEFIENEIRDFVDEIKVDCLGNLVAHKKGEGKKVLFTAHTDEIGIMANYIDENGFVRFAPVGNFSANSAVYKRVVFGNGTTGTICPEDAKSSGDVKFSSLFVDLGTTSKEETLKLIKPGDTASFEGSTIIRDNTIVSKSLSSRASVYVMIRAIKAVARSNNDLYFAFTSQKELGARGAKVVCYNIEPDCAISVDVSPTGDTPGCDTMDVKLGGGVAVKIMDKTIITHKGLREFIIRCAKDKEIPCQMEIQSDFGADAGGMQKIKSGVPTCGLSLPVRYINTTCETANIKDIDNLAIFIAELCKKDFIFS